jgi:predicted metal-dependent phosphoesterase TrpH
MILKNDEKTISLEQSMIFKNFGYLALDPHVHSSHSYDVPDSSRTIPEKIIEEQERLGLIKIITDHDTMSAHNYLSRSDVIRGVEIKIKPKKMRLVDTSDPMHTLHINVYNLNNNQFNILENISKQTADLDLFIDYIKSEKLPYQYNHPFWHEPKEIMNWKSIPQITQKYFDVVEINAGRPKALNDLAMYLAQEYNKGITSSTDTHTGRLGRAMVLAKGKNFDEMWDNIINRQMYIVRNDMTALGIVEETAQMIENIFEIKKQENKVYTLDIGIKILDDLAKKVYSAKTNKMVRKITYKGLNLFNDYLGEIVAEKIYIEKENKLGQNITDKIVEIIYKTNLQLNGIH